MGTDTLDTGSLLAREYALLRKHLDEDRDGTEEQRRVQREALTEMHQRNISLHKANASLLASLAASNDPSSSYGQKEQQNSCRTDQSGGMPRTDTSPMSDKNAIIELSEGKPSASSLQREPHPISSPSGSGVFRNFSNQPDHTPVMKTKSINSMGAHRESSGETQHHTPSAQSLGSKSVQSLPMWISGAQTALTDGMSISQGGTAGAGEIPAFRGHTNLRYVTSGESGMLAPATPTPPTRSDNQEPGQMDALRQRIEELEACISLPLSMVGDMSRSIESSDGIMSQFSNFADRFSSIRNPRRELPSLPSARERTLSPKDEDTPGFPGVSTGQFAPGPDLDTQRVFSDPTADRGATSNLRGSRMSRASGVDLLFDKEQTGYQASPRQTRTVSFGSPRSAPGTSPTIPQSTRSVGPRPQKIDRSFVWGNTADQEEEREDTGKECRASPTHGPRRSYRTDSPIPINPNPAISIREASDAQPADAEDGPAHSPRFVPQMSTGQPFLTSSVTGTSAAGPALTPTREPTMTPRLEPNEAPARPSSMELANRDWERQDTRNYSTDYRESGSTEVDWVQTLLLVGFMESQPAEQRTQNREDDDIQSPRPGIRGARKNSALGASFAGPLVSSQILPRSQ